MTAQRELKRYLGDGVYAEIHLETGGIKLSVENGIEATDIIYLDLGVINRLSRFIREVYSPAFAAGEIPGPGSAEVAEARNRLLEAQTTSDGSSGNQPPEGIDPYLTTR